MQSNPAKVDAYEQITNAIVSAIKEGADKYEMPWHALSIPLNATSRKPYRGVNVLMLWATAQKRAYTSNEWATYRQWQEAGAQVRKGEQIHNLPVIARWIRDSRKVHEQERKLERSPGGRIDCGLVFSPHHALPPSCCSCHRTICDSKCSQTVGVVQQFDSSLDAVGCDPGQSEQLLGGFLPLDRRTGDDLLRGPDSEPHSAIAHILWQRGSAFYRTIQLPQARRAVLCHRFVYVKCAVRSACPLRRARSFRLLPQFVFEFFNRR